MQGSVSNLRAHTRPQPAVARYCMHTTTRLSHALPRAHPRGMAPMRFCELPSLALSSQTARGRITPCAAAARVEFIVPDLALEFGEGVSVVGGADALGNWDASAAPALQWTEGNTWKGTVELEAGPVEFKLVKVNGGGEAAWEDGPNRAVISDTACRLVCPWGEATTVEEAEMAAAEKKMRSAAGAAEQKAKRVRSKQEDLSEKVSGLEKKVERSSTKIKSIQTPIDDKKEAVAAVEHVVAPTLEPVAAVAVEAVPAPAPASNGVDLPLEMTQLAKGISCGSDGTMTIEFSGAADGPDAATLAKRLRV